MGSPSLRTFRNRIVGAEMKAASLRGEEVQVRRLFRSPRRPSLGLGVGGAVEKPAAGAGQHQCPPSPPRRSAPPRNQRTPRVLVLSRIMGISGIREIKVERLGEHE